MQPPQEVHQMVIQAAVHSPWWQQILIAATAGIVSWIAKNQTKKLYAWYKKRKK